MRYVFGPVPSRRLGQSLGIDTIPLKTCNWNCVYCQLGRTVPLCNERREYYPREAILAEVSSALANHDPGQIDWVTFVGSGEPTLHVGLGWLIRQVKQLTELPVAIISNGALLYKPEAREELAAADAVLPSLDAGSAGKYRQINRPHPDVSFERLVNGLVAFREEYAGKLWVEIMLLQGLNDTVEALQEIATVLRRFQPDEVHINLPSRPPAETWVRQSDEEGLMRASAILGEVARVVHPAEGIFDLSGNESIEEAIVNIISRHPMRQDEVERTLSRWAPEQIAEVMAKLEEGQQVKAVERCGVRFWGAGQAHYPDETHSQRVAPR